MSDRESKDYEAFILDLADDAIITHPIAPQAWQIATQRFAETLWSMLSWPFPFPFPCPHISQPWPFLLQTKEISVKSIAAIEAFVSGLDYDSFVIDRKTYSATLRELEIIGEACGRVSDPVKSSHPEIDWRTIKDFRNVLAHEYFGVNSEIVWDVVTNKLPGLKALLEAVLRSMA